MFMGYGDNENFHSLIKKLNDGDEGAFEEIYKKCSASIAFLCQKFCDSKEDAEEVVQDTFVIAYKKAAELRGDTLLAYLRKIAIHECFRKRDKNSHRYEYIVRSDALIEDQRELDESLLPEEALQNKERQDELLWIISQLPKNRREMIYLFYYADINTEEIARLYDCTANNVRQTLFAARNAIKSELEGTSKKKAVKATAFVPLGALFLAEEQAFTASYVSAAAPNIVGTLKATVAKSIKGYVIAACVAAVCITPVAVYIASQSAVEDDVYEPPMYEVYVPATREPADDSMEDIVEEIQSLEPAEERLTQAAEPEERLEPIEEQEQTEEPEPPVEGESDPIPEPVDRTPEILAALAAAGTVGEIEGIIRHYGFRRVTSMRNATDKLLRFYVLDEGSGDILIGMAAYEDGTSWRMRFTHFVGGQMFRDMQELLRFMEQ